MPPRTSLLLFTFLMLNGLFAQTGRPLDSQTRVMSDSMFSQIVPLLEVAKDQVAYIDILKRLSCKENAVDHIQNADKFELHYLVFPLRIAQVVQPGKKPRLVPKSRILKGLNTLNKALADAWVQFEIVQWDTIYERATVKTLRDNGYEGYYDFSAHHDKSDTCTLYLLDNEESLCQELTCSRSYGFANVLETFTNNVVIDKFFVDDYKVLVHEFGHYFGLFHTAETGFGMERVDQSNCHEAGDRVCDTPADPGELYMVYVNYSNCEMKDFREENTGLEYNPQINNYMSYYYPCYMKGFVFTPGQYDVIFNAAVHVRHNQVMYLAEVPLY
jgi:hypothetical protein